MCVLAQQWDFVGHKCKNLKWMEIHILTQPCTSFTCEHSWSIFEHIHSKNRNCLTQKWMNDLVFVHHNIRLNLKKDQDRSFNMLHSIEVVLNFLNLLVKTNFYIEKIRNY